METERNIRQILLYMKDLSAKFIVIKLSQLTISSREKMLSLLKDISILADIGARIVIAHSSDEIFEDAWASTEAVKFLNVVPTKDDLINLLSNGSIPVVRFQKTEFSSPDEDIAKFGVKLGAYKLIFVTRHKGVFDENRKLIQQLTPSDAKRLLAEDSSCVKSDMLSKLTASIYACDNGIPRVHIIGNSDGMLINELFTCTGIGTMIYAHNPYQEIRKASVEDLSGIFEILRNSPRETPTPLELIKRNIENFLIFSVDGTVNGCLMTSQHGDKGIELSNIEFAEEYKNTGTIEALIRESIGRNPDCNYYLIDPRKNTPWISIYPWFSKIGFARSFDSKSGIKKSVWIRSNQGG